jgi:acyl-CoA thioesterase FadM
MYPLGRMLKEILIHRRSPKLGLLDAHLSTHRCWPWDLDPWFELNNGRTLTLYDLGRLPMLLRTGLGEGLRKGRLDLTVAGVSVRYRRRVRLWDRISMSTRLIGWDDRFLYVEQSLWRDGQCANHILLRLAVTCPNKGGLLPPEHLLRNVVGASELASPELPPWVIQWTVSESQRPWPPPGGPAEKIGP